MARIWPLPTVDFLPLADVEERRDVALISSRPVRRVVAERLRLPIVWEADVDDAVEESWINLLSDLRGEVIYAVGGGLCADCAKYAARRRGLPLVVLPTALSVDAFFTFSSGVRSDGCVTYLETGVPERVVIDWEVISEAPPDIRSAGICDVLSIATGNWDWHHAEEKGENPVGMELLPWASRVADSILQGAIDCAEAAGKGSTEGLKQLLDCLLLQAQLCNQLGHARPEEGSEHYFAYLAESRAGKGRPHGELVGPGILLIAHLQGQDVSILKEALQSSRVPVNTLPPDLVLSTLQNLPAYVRKHDLPYGIAHELDPGIRLADLQLDEILGG